MLFKSPDMETGVIRPEFKFPCYKRMAANLQIYSYYIRSAMFMCETRSSVSASDIDLMRNYVNANRCVRTRTRTEKRIDVE